MLESLRARVPATVWYAGPRMDDDPRVNKLIRLAADAGIPMIEAGRSGWNGSPAARAPGLALKIRPCVRLTRTTCWTGRGSGASRH